MNKMKNIRHFLKTRFCWHRYKSLKVGQFPLVGAVCLKCGTIKTGNCVYYDGSTYQGKLRGDDAIKFIESCIKDIDGRLEQFIELQKQFPHLLNEEDMRYLNFIHSHETVKTYREILSIIKPKMK